MGKLVQKFKFGGILTTLRGEGGENKQIHLLLRERHKIIDLWYQLSGPAVVVPSFSCVGLWMDRRRSSDDDGMNNGEMHVHIVIIKIMIIFMFILCAFFPSADCGPQRSRASF